MARSLIVWNTNELSNLKALILEKKTISEIAEVYKVKDQNIYKVLKKYNLLDLYNTGEYKSLSPKEIEKLVDERYINSNMPHTRTYLIKSFEENPSFNESRGLLVKEDFIEMFEKSRIGRVKYNYDFSKVPDIIPSSNTKLIIIINEKDAHGNEIGEWETDIKHFIYECNDPRKIMGKKLRELTLAQEKLNFISLAKKKFGDLYSYDKVDYLNYFTKVWIKCNRCGNYFLVTPNNFLQSAGKGCPDCVKIDQQKRLEEMNKKQKEDALNRFKKELQDIYGDRFSFSESDFVNRRTYINFFDNLTGETINKCPDCFLLSSENSIWRGEYIIESILNEINIDYKHKRKDTIIRGTKGRNSDIIYPDFVVENNGEKYIIEYNGEQHFKWVTWYHKTKEGYVKQLIRDENLKNYCLNNKINLIIIPYTITDYYEIKNLLYEIFINNKNFLDLISLPDVEFPENFNKLKELYGK